jgi:3-oxoacyl-[acyl-carrier protein] reductase
MAQRVVIVTGSARGLGRDYACAFAREGARVILADLHGSSCTAARLSEMGAPHLDVRTDVTDPSSTKEMVEATMAEYGRIDVLVNNAGLWRGYDSHGLLNCTVDAWKSAWDVNLTGTLLCYQAVVPVMRQQGNGRIINISSMSSVTGGSAYGLTKAAVEHMTAGMAREVGEWGITVNCLAPGVATFEGARDRIPQLDALVKRNAVPRMGTSRDLFAALRYLCSEEASWVTGQTIRVDGGALAR